MSLSLMHTIQQWRLSRKIHLALVWAPLLGVVLVVSTSASGPDDPYSRETLRGLGAVHVLIEHLQPHAEQAGLTRSQIKTDVELRLRKAGIRVLTEQERLAAPGTPYLYVNINSSQGRQAPLSDLIAFSITVELRQDALLVRNPAITALGVNTWSTSFIIGVHRESTRQIRDYVGDRVDAFINDYLSVNPRRGGNAK